MKPAPFTYHRPTTVPEAVALLSTLDNAKLLAGGQSLMPMLNMRFVLPDHVIDLNRVSGLSGITNSDGAVRIGALTRQREIEFDPGIGRDLPLMREAILNVGHHQTRNRGTIGGSLCHLDPAAELVAVAAAFDALVEVEGPNGRREVPFADFSFGFMTPGIELEEIVTAVTLQPWRPGHGSAFLEFSRRHGDFAIVSAAALLEKDAAGVITRASVTIGGIAATVMRVPEAEQMLVGQRAEEAAFRAAAEECARLEALEDAHVTAAYRQRLARTMALRALTLASSRHEVRN